MLRAKITARGAVVVDSFAIADPDYLYAAKMVIEHYGRGTASHCAKRANHLLHIGDMDGNTVWLRILADIEELKRGRRENELLNWWPLQRAGGEPGSLMPSVRTGS
jgi:hypothetical protein